MTDRREQSGDGWQVSVSSDSTLRCSFSESLHFQVVIPELCADGPEYDCAALPDAVLWLGETSSSLAVIGREVPLSLVDLYRRSGTDSAMFRQTFLEVEGLPLLIYEGGLIRFSSDGRPLWRVDHDRMDWHFQEAVDGQLWYESEDVGAWAYRLEDGSRAR